MSSASEISNLDQQSAASSTSQSTPTQGVPQKESSPVNGNSEPSASPTEIETFPIYVKTLTSPTPVKLQVSPMDNIQDIRQFLFESIESCYITCYHLTLNGQKVNDFVDLSEIKDLKADSSLEMQEGIYDEKSIRLHVRRLRDILNSGEPSISSPSLFSALLLESSDGDNNDNDQNSDKDSKDNRDKKKDKFQIDPESSSSASGSELTVDTTISPNASLTGYYSSAAHYQHQSQPRPSQTLQCVKTIVFSGWNPPPGYRRLMGDLVYLEITLLEGRNIHVTGWSKGFFINGSSSNIFDPNPDKSNTHTYHELVDLLQNVSPLFKANFEKVLSNNLSKHPYEVIPVPFSVTPWVQVSQSHKFDLNRAEDHLFVQSDSDIRGQLRDWNEEYQTWKELPNQTIQERIVRDRAIIKLNAEFVEAAIKGATGIVEKSILPINPLDNEKAHMFIFNNIFFSYALDGRDFYKQYGGDQAAYTSINNDLRGIKQVNKADIQGLHTLATAIIDYRGHRICAQSIIPGILQREQTSTVVYGSLDNGKKIAGDESFHALMCTLGKQLYIKEHSVIDESGTDVKLCSPVEAKGIVGTDGRKYILDLVRMTPRDSNYLDTTQHMFTILRPELVGSYCEYLQQKHRMEVRKERKEKELQEKEKEKEQAKEKDSGKAEFSISNASTSPDTSTNATASATSGSNAEKLTTEKSAESLPKSAHQLPNNEHPDLQFEEGEYDDIEVPDIRLNPNVYCTFKLSGTAEDIAKDEAMVKDASDFVHQTLIPVLIEDFQWLLSLPVDGQTLTQIMHSRGINMRYLGLIARLVNSKKPILHEICVREMITRSCKHIFKSIVRQTEEYNLSRTVTHLLNCLIGDVGLSSTANDLSSEDIKNKKGKGKLKNSPISTSELADTAQMLTSVSLWEQIKTDVHRKFRYDLPVNRHSTAVTSLLSCVQTLRSICQKVGIQVQARDIDFSCSIPITTDDILFLFPLVKHINHQSSDGRKLLDAGKGFLAQGRLDVAYELLTEALAIFHQVYGPIHVDTANCYSNLAMVIFHAKDEAQAIDYQQKAVIIYERVLGLDHFDTAHAYSTLALFYHSEGKIEQALIFMKRAMYINILTAGIQHPETASTLANIATMLQDNKEPKEAIVYLLEALKVYESTLGSSHLQVSAIYHSIALAFSQLGQYKEALSYEKKNYNILHNQVGDTDIRTIESNIWLKRFTQQAVQAQMETKKTERLASKISLEQIKNNINQSVAANLNVNNTGTKLPSDNSNLMGNRPLNEVLQYINGKSETSTSFLQRNPKKFRAAAPGTGKTQEILSQFGVNVRDSSPFSTSNDKKKSQPKKKKTQGQKSKKKDDGEED